MEQEFWQRLGIQMGPCRADDRDVQEIEDYAQIIRLILREEHAQAKAAERQIRNV